MIRLTSLILVASVASCATPSPNWTEVTFIKIPRLDGSSCYVQKPPVISNWILTYSDMVHQCQTKGHITLQPEMET